MVKSAQPGEGGGCRTPSPFNSIYHHQQSCSVRSSWEGRYNPLISSLEGRYTPPFSPLPLYVLCGREGDLLRRQQQHENLVSYSKYCIYPVQPMLFPYFRNRRKIRLIKGNTKCRHQKNWPVKGLCGELNQRATGATVHTAVSKIPAWLIVSPVYIRLPLSPFTGKFFQMTTFCFGVYIVN